MDRSCSPVWAAMIVGLGSWMAAPHASAALIGIPPELFSGTENVARFEGPGHALPYTESGATFRVFNIPPSWGPATAGNGRLVLPAPNLPGSIVSMPTLQVTFAEPVRRVGFVITDFWSTTTLSVLGEGFADPGGLASLGAATSALSAGYPPQFVGFASDTPMSRIDLTFSPRVGTSFLSIDDFRFEGVTSVPEAPMLSLIVLGVAGVARYLWQVRR